MKAQVRMEDHSTDISKLKLQEKIILPPKPEKPAVMHPHEAYPLPAADEWSFPKIWPQRFLISHTETERTSHQNQLKWEEMQSPKYLSYLDLGLLTNLHWDMVTHCSTWREKQCLLKRKKKKSLKLRLQKALWFPVTLWTVHLLSFSFLPNTGMHFSDRGHKVINPTFPLHFKTSFQASNICASL